MLYSPSEGGIHAQLTLTDKIENQIMSVFFPQMKVFPLTFCSFVVYGPFGLHGCGYFPIDAQIITCNSLRFNLNL